MAFSDREKVRLMKEWFIDKLESFDDDDLAGFMSFLYTINWAKIKTFLRNKIQGYKTERNDGISVATEQNTNADELDADIDTYTE